MKKIIFFLLFLPVCLYSQKKSNYAYVVYSNSGGYEKCSVLIHFSSDSVLDYLSLKKEMRVGASDIFSHSFEVIEYMKTLGFSPISISQEIPAPKTNVFVLLFKKDTA